MMRESTEMELLQRARTVGAGTGIFWKCLSELAC